MLINFKDSFFYTLFKLFAIPACILIYFFRSNTLISENFNFPNFATLFLSLIIFLLSIESIKISGVRSFNLFLSVYFLFLMLNTFNFSNLQMTKTFIDIYYFFVGPAIFALFLYFGEKIEIRRRISLDGLPTINLNYLVLVLWATYLICNVYIFYKVGFILLSDDLLRYQDESKYVVPGVSGLVAILLWTLLIMIPNIKKRLSIPIILSIIVISGILQFSRGNIFRVLLFLVLYFLVSRGQDVLKKKIIIPIIAAIIVFSSLFAVLGEFRQYDTRNVFNISYLLESNVGNPTIDWIYAYSALNFDVLKLIINNASPAYYPETLLMPVDRFINGNSEIAQSVSETAQISLNGFNASTFMSGFILDFGPLFIIEVMVLGLVIGIFINLVKKRKYIGLYVLILMLISMSVFGNYFTVPSFSYAIVLSFFLLSITSRKTSL